MTNPGKIALLMSEGFYVDDAGVKYRPKDQEGDWVFVEVEKPLTYRKDIGTEEIIFYFALRFEPRPTGDSATTAGMDRKLVAKRYPMYFDANGDPRPREDVHPFWMSLLDNLRKRYKTQEPWEALANEVRDMVSRHIRSRESSGDVDPIVEKGVENFDIFCKDNGFNFGLIAYPRSSTKLTESIAVAMLDHFPNAEVVEISKDTPTISDEDKNNLKTTRRSMAIASKDLRDGVQLESISELPITVLTPNASQLLNDALKRAILDPKILRLSKEPIAEDIVDEVIDVPCPKCGKTNWNMYTLPGKSVVQCKVCNYIPVTNTATSRGWKSASLTDYLQLLDYIKKQKGGNQWLNDQIDITNRRILEKEEEERRRKEEEEEREREKSRLQWRAKRAAPLHVGIERPEIAEIAKKVLSQMKGEIWDYNPHYPIVDGKFEAAGELGYNIKGALEQLATINALKYIREEQERRAGSKKAKQWIVPGRISRKGRAYTDIFREANIWALYHIRLLIGRAIGSKEISYGKAVEAGTEFMTVYASNPYLEQQIAKVEPNSDILIADDNIKSGATMSDIARVIIQVAKKHNKDLGKIVHFALYRLFVSPHTPRSMVRDEDDVPAVLPEHIIAREPCSMWDDPEEWNPQEISIMITEDPDVPAVPIIEKFRGKYRFLSNFWPAVVALDQYQYPTVEHAYQAAKTLDQAMRRKIRQTEKPGQTKKLGRKVEMRPDWEQIKLQVMEDLVRQKFTRHPELGAQLIATGDAEIQEGNTWGDRFWGVDAKTGEGENHLGRILMKIRDELR